MNNPSTHVHVSTSPTQRKIDHYWNSRAAAYHHHQRVGERAHKERAVWANALSSVLGVQPLEVLDVGTGTGYIAQLLADLGHRVHGIDSSSGMLEQARAEASKSPTPASFALGDAVTPEVPPASVDVVTSRYVMWTLREPHVALDNWYQALRPGGKILAIDAHHFPNGIDAITQVESTAGEDAFVKTYDEKTVAHLPLAENFSVEAYQDYFTRAGLVDVRAIEVEEIFEIETEYGVSPGHIPLLPYIFVGTKPA